MGWTASRLMEWRRAGFRRALRCRKSCKRRNIRLSGARARPKKWRQPWRFWLRKRRLTSPGRFWWWTAETFFRRSNEPENLVERISWISSSQESALKPRFSERHGLRNAHRLPARAPRDTQVSVDEGDARKAGCRDRVCELK